MIDITKEIETIIRHIQCEANNLPNGAPFFYPGTEKEVETLIGQQLIKPDYQFPCIILQHPIKYRQSKDSWVTNEIDLTFILCAECPVDMKTLDRIDYTMIPILRPLLNSLLDGLMLSKAFDNWMLKFEDYDSEEYMFYGTKAHITSKMTAPVDAIALNFRSLKIRKSINCLN